MISYDPFFDTMNKKDLNQTDLLKRAGFSNATFSAMKHGEYVNLHTLETLCRLLGCNIEDIVKVIPEDDWEAIKPGSRRKSPKYKSDENI